MVIKTHGFTAKIGFKKYEWRPDKYDEEILSFTLTTCDLNLEKIMLIISFKTFYIETLSFLNPFFKQSKKLKRFNSAQSILSA